jgi:hypothetical protein
MAVGLGGKRLGRKELGGKLQGKGSGVLDIKSLGDLDWCPFR